MSGEESGSAALERDLIAHLTELRKRLIAASLWFACSLAAGLYASPRILAFVKTHLNGVSVEWSVFSLSDGIAVYMKVALMAGLLLSLPVFVYQLWAFARPGMTDKEAANTLLFVPLSFVLFAAGVIEPGAVIDHQRLRKYRGQGARDAVRDGILEDALKGELEHRQTFGPQKREVWRKRMCGMLPQRYDRTEPIKDRADSTTQCAL